MQYFAGINLCKVKGKWPMINEMERAELPWDLVEREEKTHGVGAVKGMLQRLSVFWEGRERRKWNGSASKAEKPLRLLVAASHRLWVDSRIHLARGSMFSWRMLIFLRSGAKWCFLTIRDKKDLIIDPKVRKAKQLWQSDFFYLQESVEIVNRSCYSWEKVIQK